MKMSSKISKKPDYILITNPKCPIINFYYFLKSRRLTTNASGETFTGFLQAPEE